MSSGQVIYEVNLWPDASIDEAFDAWLAHHVEEMLQLPGFVGASVHRVEGEGDGGAQRTVHYRLRDRSALDAYLKEHAQRMRADGLSRFGDRFRATRRILDAGRDLVAQETANAACANCSAPLHGQYCADCGQRARGRMISLWELIKEASEILTSLDSRLWRSLGVLLFLPGRLTRDYLLGKRARYIPALRLFLGLSILFFFLFSLDARFGVISDGGDDGDVSLQIQIGDDEAADTPPDTAPADEAPAAGGTVGETPPQTSGGTVSGTTPETADSGTSEEEQPCDDIKVSWPENWRWMEQWLSTDRVKTACEKIVADHGESFSRALLERIPAMMFLFLPLMAVVMKLLYPLSRRFYVEHLLFLVHYHAFFYLLLSLCLLAGWLFTGDLLPDWPVPVLYAVATVYIPLYLFLAMRRVYGQGWALTALKYSALGIAYLACLVVFLISTVTITAVTL